MAGFGDKIGLLAGTAAGGLPAGVVMGLNELGLK